MASCRNCGAAMQDGARFCPACGSDNAAGAAQPADRAQTGSNDTLMGVLAYLSLLVLIPICTQGNSSFVRYHANQGLVLLIFEVAYGIVVTILGTIFFTISWQLALTMSTVFYIVSLAFLVLSVIGIVNVVGGREKPLPVIGSISILK